MDFASLQYFIFSERPYESEIHGLEHWRQVEFNGLLLVPETGADITVVRLFSLFHDSKRFEDGHDAEHGPRGAEFAKWCLENKLLELDNERFEKLYHACANHTRESSSGDATIDTCYDADRLDLGRVAIPPDPRKMATEAGKKIARRLSAAGISVFHHREWIRNFRF